MVEYFTHCLQHQRPATRTTPWGPLCPDCVQQLRELIAERPIPPRRYWLSQPRAYTLDGRPRFVSVVLVGDVMFETLAVPEPAADPRVAARTV